MIAHFAMLAFTLTAPVPALNAEALKKEQEAAWFCLLKDEQMATRALFKFSNRPAESVAFLKTKLKPLIIDEKSVKKFIADLDSENEKVWGPAFETLEYFDPRLAMTLQDCFEEAKTVDGRFRLASVLSGAQLELCITGDDKSLTLMNHGDGGFSFRMGNTSISVESEKRLFENNSFYIKKQWKRIQRVIILLEQIGSKEAVACLKTIASGHKKAGPTIEASEALTRLNAE